MKRQVTEFACDRCGLIDQHPSLMLAQEAGWSTVIVLKGGAALDSDHRWRLDACPSCCIPLADWADDRTPA